MLVGRERRALEAVREQWSRRGVSAQLLWCSDRGFASDEGAALGMEDTPALVQALARLLPETGSSGVVFVAGDRDCELAVEAALEADVVTLMALAKALENTNRPVRRLAVACLGDSQPSAFGARGVARALAQEWRSRELSVSAVVARGSFDPDVLGRALFAQSADTDLTLSGDELGREVLVTRELAEPSPDEPGLELGPKHVILLVGGAVGIAAEMACSLAERFGCSVTAIGRTPYDGRAPFAEIDDAGLGAAVHAALEHAGALVLPERLRLELARVEVEGRARDG